MARGILFSPKLEALRNLHSAMVRCHYDIIRVEGCVLQNDKDYQEQVKRPELEFLEAFTLAGIYLDKELHKMMGTVLGSLRQMSAFIWVRLPEQRRNS